MAGTLQTPISEARKRILCVEDDADGCEMMTIILEQLGYKARAVSSAVEAMEKINSEAFDLYILDVCLPDEDGISLCRRIRSTDSQTPILFQSGHAYPQQIEEALSAGAQAYVTKPNIEKLLTMVPYLIGESLAAT